MIWVFEPIRFGLGQIQRPGDVFVFVVELVDGTEVGGLRGVALLDLFDVAEDLALLLGDGEQFAGLDQRVDLLERLR